MRIKQKTFTRVFESTLFVHKTTLKHRCARLQKNVLNELNNDLSNSKITTHHRRYLLDGRHLLHA